jgi:TPR repeat protein
MVIKFVMTKFVLTFIAVTLLYANNDYLYALKAYYDESSSNDITAIETLKMQNIPDAAFLVAVAYEQGKMVKQDSIEALKWYEKAAGLGDVDAMLMSAWYYYKGDVIEKNSEKAKVWFEKASDLGDKEATEMLELFE